MAKYWEKKIIKVASWQPQGRVKKDKESVNNVVRTAVFFTVDIMQISFAFFFFSQAPTMRGDSAVRISLRSQRVWQCFGSAANLNALITNTVTLPPDWEIHFVSSHGTALYWQWNCQTQLFLLYLQLISKMAGVSCRIEYRCKKNQDQVLPCSGKTKPPKKQKNKRQKKKKQCQEWSLERWWKDVFFFFFYRDRDQIDLHSTMNLIQLETLHVSECIWGASE